MTAQDNLKAFAIAGRTASGAATAVDDVDQEELRLPIAALITPGLLPNLLTQAANANGFRVRQNTGSDMNLLVGSGTSKVDGYVLLGSVAGQGAYVIRLDATTKTVSVPATDPTNPARYGVYAYIDDTAYSGTASRAYANVSCIRGTPAGSPVTPTALAAWSASSLLWEFQLPANATAVTNTILDAGTDRRARARAALGPLVVEASVTSQQIDIPTTPTDRTGLTVTFNGPGARRYKISTHGVLSSPTGTGAISVNILTGASGAGTAVGGWAVNTTSGTTNTWDFAAFHTPAAGSTSYHVQVNTAAGLVISYGSATVPAWLTVEDVGPG